MKPTDAQVEAFKKAWNEADAEGRVGERVRDGLEAVFDHLDVTIWVNAFRTIRPTDTFLMDLGREVLLNATIPGQTTFKFSIT